VKRVVIPASGLFNPNVDARNLKEPVRPSLLVLSRFLLKGERFMLKTVQKDRNPLCAEGPQPLFLAA